MSLKKLQKVHGQKGLSGWRTRRRKLVVWPFEENQWSCLTRKNQNSSYPKLSLDEMDVNPKRRLHSHQRNQRRWRPVSSNWLIGANISFTVWLVLYESLFYKAHKGWNGLTKKCLVRKIMNWSRANRPNPSSLKTVIVNRKDDRGRAPNEISSFDSDLFTKHVKKCDHYYYNCKVCNMARLRQERGKTNR